MVHALTEVHRVLTPGGRAADLRPDRRLDGGRRRRDVLAKLFYHTSHGEVPLGVLQEGSFVDDEAADRAVRWAVRRGLFRLESTETFAFRYSFRDLAVLDEYLGGRETAHLDGATRRRLQRLTRRQPGQILSVEILRLNVLRKV